MSDETTMLPCPFCGGEATVERIGKSGYYYVACNTAYCCDFGKFDTESEAIAAWNTRATHGTLTAEQVMAIAGKHQPDYCSDTHVCFDWQAIADELNAELGCGTCEVVSSIYHGDELYGYDEIELSCGHGFVWMDNEPPRHCPDCGKAVEQ